MLSQREKKLLEALEPLAQGKGVEIVTVEVVGAKKSPTIRVYIDSEGGISFDELAASQVWINEVMDEIDPFPGAYTLEVSSPGIDRPLRTPQHFIDQVGNTAVIKTVGPIEGRSSFTGTVVSADQDGVTMDIEGEQVTVPYAAMKKARLKGEINFSR